MNHLFRLLFALLFTINGAAAQSADAVFYMEMDTLGGGIRAGQEYDLYYKSAIPFDSVSPPAFDARIEVIKGPLPWRGSSYTLENGREKSTSGEGFRYRIRFAGEGAVELPAAGHQKGRSGVCDARCRRAHPAGDRRSAGGRLPDRTAPGEARSGGRFLHHADLLGPPRQQGAHHHGLRAPMPPDQQRFAGPKRRGAIHVHVPRQCRTGRQICAPGRKSHIRRQALSAGSHPANRPHPHRVDTRLRPPAGDRRRAAARNAVPAAPLPPGAQGGFRRFRAASQAHSPDYKLGADPLRNPVLPCEHPDVLLDSHPLRGAFRRPGGQSLAGPRDRCGFRCCSPHC